MPVNPAEVLEGVAKLPISTWTYRDEQSITRHMGPMAQDFMATFHVGYNDRTIFQVDADGVALAAIQSLNNQVKRLNHENETLREEIRQVKREMTRFRTFHGNNSEDRRRAQ